MLAHNALIKVAPYPVTSIPTLDFVSIMGSVFLMKSLLLAIVKECTSTSKETEIKISILKQKLFYLANQENISEADFEYIETQLYLILSEQSGFKQLPILILNEKLHIDKMLRLLFRFEDYYKPTMIIYEKILISIQSNNVTATSNALCELAKTLEEYACKAKKNYPEFFK